MNARHAFIISKARNMNLLGSRAGMVEKLYRSTTQTTLRPYQIKALEEINATYQLKAPK